MDVDHFVTNTTHSLVFIALQFPHPTKLSITQQFTIGCAFSQCSFKLQTTDKSKMAVQTPNTNLIDP